MSFYFFHQTGEIKLRKYDEKLFAIYIALGLNFWRIFLLVGWAALFIFYVLRLRQKK
jgi:hypothetical protein